MSSNGNGRPVGAELSPAELNRLTSELHRHALSIPGAARQQVRRRIQEEGDAYKRRDRAE
jgi:hypothetical protein